MHTKHVLLAAGILLTQATQAQTNLQITAGDATAIRKAMVEKEFSGTLLVLQGSATVLNINEGRTNEINGTSFSPDVRINTCSNGKTMTAVLIQQLVAAGKLHSDQTVAQLLPEKNNYPMRIR